MAIQYSNTVNDARLNSIETTIGVSPTLVIFDGIIPETCASPNVGNVVSTMTLPVDWMADANNAQAEKLGTWEDPSASANGTAKYFRIFDGANCHLQGNCGVTGFGSDLEFDTIFIAPGDSVNIASFVLIAGNQTQ